MIADSGDRTTFDTGAVRDMHGGKGRCDLIPIDFFPAEFEELDLIKKFKYEGNLYYLYQAFILFASKNFEVENRCYSEAHLANAYLEVAKHFEEGALKYGENNWQKGIPVHSYIDSAIRHYLKFMRGDNDERHDRAFLWNLLCCAWTMRYHPELDDYTEKGNEK